MKMFYRLELKSSKFFNDINRGVYSGSDKICDMLGLSRRASDAHPGPHHDLTLKQELIDRNIDYVYDYVFGFRSIDSLLNWFYYSIKNKPMFEQIFTDNLVRIAVYTCNDNDLIVGDKQCIVHKAKLTQERVYDDIEFLMRSIIDRACKEDLKEYYNALKRHDWYYERSDDPRVYLKYSNEENKLLSESKTCLIKHHMFCNFRSNAFSGEVFGLPKIELRSFESYL